MKKWIIVMVTVFMFPKLLVAQELDVDALLGENWYGLYMNGQKAGYSQNSLTRNDDGNLVVLEDARFQIRMAGIQQDMQVYTQRVYDPSGDLMLINSRVTDPAGVSEFLGRVEGEHIILKSRVGGSESETVLPKPDESLADAIRHAQWVKGDPKPGDVLNFSVFEPMYQKEIGGMSHIVDIEERIFEGVATKVYKIKTSLDIMNLESIAYVAEDGTTLEDVVSGILVMRLELEEQAKDGNYNNDVIVSNAVRIEQPLAAPRSRETLRLKIEGPITKDQIFSDNRQKMVQQADHILFSAKQQDMSDFTAVRLPVEDTTVLPWTNATMFVQSDNEKVRAKAKEIVGEEKDTLKISNLLCEWVNTNMRSTFSARLTNTLEVLSSLEGDCTEHSILFIGLARAAGVPAREVAGLVYVQGPEPGFYFHQWAQVWVGQWIDVDPTFDQPLADVTHIKLAEGDLLHQSRIIPVIGQLKIEVLEDPVVTSAGP